MANQYGTKAWAKWANQTLGVAIELLRDPNNRWDEEMSNSERSVKSLRIIEKELEEVLARKS